MAGQAKFYTANLKIVDSFETAMFITHSLKTLKSFTTFQTINHFDCYVRASNKWLLLLLLLLLLCAENNWKYGRYIFLQFSCSGFQVLGRNVYVDSNKWWLQTNPSLQKQMLQEDASHIRTQNELIKYGDRPIYSPDARNFYVNDKCRKLSWFGHVSGHDRLPKSY